MKETSLLEVLMTNPFNIPIKLYKMIIDNAFVESMVVSQKETMYLRSMAV